MYANKCLAIGGDGASAGSPAVIADCTGAVDQQWELNADLSVSSVSHPGLCLEAAGTGNGSAVGVESCSGESNQQWART